MKITKILLAALLTALSTINVSAQFLNNYCDASFQYSIDTTTCTLTANATYIYPDLNYTWYIGGQTFTGNSVSYSYNYSGQQDFVYLQVSDNFGGCNASKEEQVDITCAPYSCVGTAAFTVSIDSTNCVATFTPTATQPNLIYNWYFGDGAFLADSTGAAVTHSYPFNSTYITYLSTNTPDYYCQDFSEQSITVNCSSSLNDVDITIVEDSANCQTAISVINPNSNYTYNWIIGGSTNYYYTGSSINVEFHTGGSLAHISLSILDTTTHFSYHVLDSLFTPSCGTTANCNLDAAFTYTFDSTACTYTFTISNPVAGVHYGWAIGGQHLAGNTVTYQPTYENMVFNATLNASQLIPNTHYYCTDSQSENINPSCGINGACDLDGAYTISYDSTNCTYTFTVSNPSSLPNVTYQWSIGHFSFTGPQAQFTFPYANQTFHAGLAIYTNDHICSLHQGFTFTPACGTLGDCDNDILSFAASSSSDPCEATVTLTQPLGSNTNYYWYIPTINLAQGGLQQSGPSTSVTFPTPYLGVYPITLYAVTFNGCTLDTTLYFNATCGAMPRACYTEPVMQVDATDPMAMWFTITNIRAENTYHWDFGDGESTTFDPALHYYGMMHRYNAPGTYQATLTVTSPTCNSSFERTVNMGTTTGTETVDTADEQFSLFPNPANDVLNLQLSNAINTASILEIFNTQGQRVLSQSINATLSSIDVSTFSAGLYTLRVVDANSAVIGTKRFVVNK